MSTHLPALLPEIAGGNQQHAVQPEYPAGFHGSHDVADMDRIEGTPEDPEPF